MSLNLSIHRGDDKTYTITVTNKATGLARDITGWVIWFTAKRNVDDSDEDAVIGPKRITSHTNAAQGISALSFSKTETDLPEDCYFCDMQFKDENGKIQSTDVGVIEISKDVTTEDT